MPLGWTFIAIAAGFLFAMAMAISSARPSLFGYAGSLPESWLSNLHEKRPLDASLAEQLANYNRRMKDNAKILERSATLMEQALWIGWASLFAGGLVAIYLLATRPV